MEWETIKIERKRFGKQVRPGLGYRVKRPPPSSLAAGVSASTLIFSICPETAARAGFAEGKRMTLEIQRPTNMGRLRIFATGHLRLTRANATSRSFQVMAPHQGKLTEIFPDTPDHVDLEIQDAKPDDGIIFDLPAAIAEPAAPETPKGKGGRK